jgi:hypothetical protein
MRLKFASFDFWEAIKFNPNQIFQFCESCKIHDEIAVYRKRFGGLKSMKTQMLNVNRLF